MIGVCLQVISWQTLHWYPETYSQCLRKQRSDRVCSNYIRIVTPMHFNYMLMCGTNGGNPTCRKYLVSFLFLLFFFFYWNTKQSVCLFIVNKKYLFTTLIEIAVEKHVTLSGSYNLIFYGDFLFLRYGFYLFNYTLLCVRIL